MKKALLVLMLFLGVYHTLSAQVEWKCDTKTIKFPVEHIGPSGASFLLDTSILYIPTTVNIVGDDDGLGYFPIDKTLESLCDLQMDFAPYQFHFYLENLRYINSSTFYSMPEGYPHSNEMFLFLSEHNALNTMNIYLVEGAGSYVVWIDTFDVSVPPAMLFPQQHSLIIAKSNVANTEHILTHEAGHYFGLWHTFNGWENIYYPDSTAVLPDTLHQIYIDNGVPFDWQIPVERVNGNNCAHAGDLVCDTPPDYISFGFFCNANQQSNLVQYDPDGVAFRSDGTLFMSYSNDACQNRFSPDQVSWMRAVAEGPREYLLYDQTPPPVFSPGNWSLLYPANNETVTVLDSVSLEWEAAVNADFYVLDFGVKVSNSLLLPLINKKIVYGTSFNVGGLNPTINYYWKISAYSKYNLCEPITQTRFFSVNPVSATAEMAEASALRVFPNPASDRLYWQLPEQVFKPADMLVQLFDSQGRLLPAEVNISEQVLDTQGFLPGVYLLKIAAGERIYSERFVKQ